MRRLTSLTSLAGAFGYAYDLVELQRVDTLTLPNGAVITNGYDGNARLTRTELLNSSGTDLDSYAYTYNQASERTEVVRTAGDYVNYGYDPMGELLSARATEPGGVSQRWQEQFGYAYDAAGNLNVRTNNTLLQTYGVNTLNELTLSTNAGSLTVAGTTTTPATSVTVNSSNAVLYADTAFASTNQPWSSGANTYTAIAQNAAGNRSTNSVTVNLTATNGYIYDLNGNLLTDGTRYFAYDDENELISVWPNRDPFRERGGLNLYEFVLNDAVDNSDPLGLACVEASGKSGHPLMAFTDPSGGWSGGSAVLGDKAGSNPFTYNLVTVKYKANVSVLCQCACGYQIRNGVRVFEQSAAGSWPAWDIGTVGIGIDVPSVSGILQGLGKLGAKWIKGVIGTGVMAQSDVDEIASAVAALPQPKNPWDGSWKGGKSPCDK